MSAAGASVRAKVGTIRGWRRGYWLVGGVAAFGLAGFVIAVWYAYNQGVVEGTETAAPLIRAAATQTKRRPDEPGGMEVPNRDKLIYDRLSPEAGEIRIERLLPPPETPLPKPGSLGANARLAAAEPLPKVETRDAVSPAANPVQLTPANGPADDAAEAIAAPPEVIVGGEGPALAAVPDVAAEPPSQAWRIQIASMFTPEAAEQAWASLQAKHKDLLGALSLDIRKATIEGRGTFYRVRAGPLDGRQAAAALCSALKARKQGCLVVQP